MGKLNHDPYIHHSSHPHPLELTNPQTLSTLCSACKLNPSGWMYTCKPCNFTLHLQCSQMPTLITHPAHPMHPLALLTVPAYPVGSFNCDACGSQGQGFSYHCSYCDFDIHTTCASHPLSLAHQAHPHELNLSFYPPYQTKGFSCDICRNIGSNHWLYRCAPCEFDAHLECATSIYNRPVASSIQHHNSFPGANIHSYGTRINRPTAQVNAYMHSQSLGTMQTCYQQPIRNNNMAGNALRDSTLQGFVEGAAQAGQNFVQGITDGGVNNDPNSDGGNYSSSFINDAASSILSGMFGNSDS